MNKKEGSFKWYVAPPHVSHNRMNVKKMTREKGFHEGTNALRGRI